MKKILYDFNKERTVYRVYEGEPTIPITENLIELEFIDKKPEIDFTTQYFKDKKEILDLEKLTYTIEYIVDDKPDSNPPKINRVASAKNIKKIILNLCDLKEAENSNRFVIDGQEYYMTRKAFLRNMLKIFGIENDKVKKKDFLLHWYFSKTFSNDCIWANKVADVLGYDVEDFFDMEEEMSYGD